MQKKMSFESFEFLYQQRFVIYIYEDYHSYNIIILVKSLCNPNLCKLSVFAESSE